MISTIWGADWDSCSTADYVIITLDPSSCCILEILIITISLFQHLCPYELDQHLEFPYHICSHCFLVKTYDNLSSIVNSYEEWFIWWSFLKHCYWISISWCFGIMLFIHQYSCHFFPKLWILFSSRLKWLIVEQWFEESCLYWRLNKFHVLYEVVNFIIYKTWFCCWWYRFQYLV